MEPRGIHGDLRGRRPQVCWLARPERAVHPGDRRSQSAAAGESQQRGCCVGRGDLLTSRDDTASGARALPGYGAALHALGPWRRVVGREAGTVTQLALAEFHPFEAAGRRFLYLVPSAAVFGLDEASGAVLDTLAESP